VSVLIDGDCMTVSEHSFFLSLRHCLKVYLLNAISSQFFDDLIRSAQQGGIEAVRRLRTKICDYVSTELDLSSHIPIRIRIYANTKGLASAYCYNKILDGVDDLVMFICGFNMGYPMCDFIDAGDGKECADSKLKGNVKPYNI